MSFVVTKKYDPGVTVYWTGETTNHTLKAVKTHNLSKAKRFDTASEAYAACLTRPELQDWKVKNLETAGEA